MRKAVNLIRLIRPVNSIMMGVAVLVGAVMTGIAVEQDAPFNLINNLTLGFLTGFFLTGATMAVNDYFDREIDAINEPQRPIPSGAVKPGEALFLAGIFTTLGFLTATLINIQNLAFAFFAWMVFVIYTTRGKQMGFLGNLMVSLCISAPFVYGGLAVGKGIPYSTGIFVLMVFLSNTGREITKGIVDVIGDRENGINTLAVHFGEQKAAVAATAFYISAVLLTPLPPLLRLVSFWFLPCVILTDIGLVSSSISLLLNQSRDNARRIKTLNLIWFSTGLLAFMAGTIN